MITYCFIYQCYLVLQVCPELFILISFTLTLHWIYLYNPMIGNIYYMTFFYVYNGHTTNIQD